MKKLVLVVDDDDSIREAVCDVLNDEGYQAVGAENGRQALDFLRAEGGPCLILLDLMMPVMDGATFRAKQLGDPHLSRIPVAIITAAGLQAAHGVPAHAILAKPLRIETLLGVVQQFCPIS